LLFCFKKDFILMFFCFMFVKNRSGLFMLKRFMF